MHLVDATFLAKEEEEDKEETKQKYDFMFVLSRR